MSKNENHLIFDEKSFSVLLEKYDNDYKIGSKIQKIIDVIQYLLSRKDLFQSYIYNETREFTIKWITTIFAEQKNPKEKALLLYNCIEIATSIDKIKKNDKCISKIKLIFKDL